MIELQNLTKKYAGFTAVEGLSCTIDAGSIFGLVGFNGAGKTTLLKTIAGVYRPDGGRALFDGEDIYENARLKSQTFLLPDEPYFLPQGSLNGMAGFYRGFYPGWSQQTFLKLVRLFGLDPDARINGFSKGMQRQAAMALALACRPRLLLLDESFDGLDLAKRNLLRRILQKYTKKISAVVVASSHNLREMEDLADHLGIIRDHRFCFNDSVDAMRRSCQKYRVTFERGADLEPLQGLLLRILHREQNDTGVSITCLTTQAGGDVAQLLAGLHPLLVESMPVSLEEFFLEGEEEPEDALEDLF